MKCYIDNSVHLQSCIRNVNNYFWCCCWGSQLTLSTDRLSRIVLVSIVSLRELSLALCLLLVFTWKYGIGLPLRATHHTDLEPSLGKPRIRVYSPKFFRSGIQELSGKSLRTTPGISVLLDMRFRQRENKTIAEAWERFHDEIAGLPDMPEWLVTQRFFFGLNQSARKFMNAEAGGVFFLLKSP